jgi:hypothetical protein
LNNARVVGLKIYWQAVASELHGTCFCYARPRARM